MKDETWVKEQVEAKGGAFKGGFVKSITCLVINPDYERETTKLTKTKALIAEGKDIKIVTLSEFKELVEYGCFLIDESMNAAFLEKDEQ